MLTRMFRCAVVGAFCVALAATALAQQSSPADAPGGATASAPHLSPSEAYRYATQPYVDARNAPNDLTDADQWALGESVVRAREQCEALKALPLQPPAAASSAPQKNEVAAGQSVVTRTAPSKNYETSILDLGRLCAFGQDLDPARAALVHYLSLPGIKDAKSAHLLLARVFVGLGWYTSAESQMDSLISLFPYDADTHLAIDQTIDGAEAGNATDVVDRLNALQLPYTMEALSAGGVLKGKENQVDAATLAEDAIRCAAAMRNSGKRREAEALIQQVKALTSAPEIAQTASKPEIDNALARYALINRPIRRVYGASLQGELILKSGRTVPVAKPLTGKRTVLIAVSLGAPASADVLAKFMTGLRQAKLRAAVQVVTITSYAATSGVDERSDPVLKALVAFAGSLPADVPLLLVPDTTIKAFAIDAFPAAAIITPAGRIAFLDLMPGTNGSIHQLLQAALPPQLHANRTAQP